MSDDRAYGCVIDPARQAALDLAVRNYGPGGFFSTADVLYRAAKFERYLRGELDPLAGERHHEADRADDDAEQPDRAAHNERRHRDDPSLPSLARQPAAADAGQPLLDDRPPVLIFRAAKERLRQLVSNLGLA